MIKTVMVITIIFLAAGVLYLAINPIERSAFTDVQEREYRNDFIVVFEKAVVDQLNADFDPEGDEYMYCLAGYQNGSTIYVWALIEQDILAQNPYQVKYDPDPPCQVANSVGSVHSHPTPPCWPSDNDLFAFGEMKNPEPLITMIACGVDDFLIMKMPGQYEGLDYRSLRWDSE